MSYIPHLRQLRFGQGWSQAKLARQSGLDRTTIAKCENGHSVSDLSCARIKNALDAAYGGKPILEIVVVEGGKTDDFPKDRKKKPGA